MVKAKPDGYNNVMPYLVVESVGPLIDFLKSTFGAEEMMRMENERGSHAEVRIGDSVVMMGSGVAEMKPAQLYVYVDDTDATFKRATAAGGTSFEDPNDTFYGDRRAGVKDAFGNQWWIATHVSDEMTAPA
jgi:PhnB protein